MADLGTNLLRRNRVRAVSLPVGVMRTPVEVTEGLFARVREHFSDEQLAEITALLTVVNLDRFNACGVRKVDRATRRRGIRGSVQRVGRVA
jgi:hypothetical protein